MVRNVLIAEDNKFTAMQYKKFLEVNGYTEITHVGDGGSLS